MKDEHNEGKTNEKMGELGLEWMLEPKPDDFSLQFGESRKQKLGTARPHIAAVNEWRENVWEGCGVRSDGPDSFLGVLEILEPSSLGDNLYQLARSQKLGSYGIAMLDRGVTALPNLNSLLKRLHIWRNEA